MNKSAKDFRYYVLRLIDAEKGYEYGKETPLGADCSGTISYPLIKMGYKIRTTADELCRKIFTDRVAEKDELDLDRIMAVFYVMNKPWTKLSGEKMPVGTVRHVTPVVGRYVVCDADWGRDQIILKTAKDVRMQFEGIGANAVWREINWDAVLRYNNILYYNPDPELLDSINNTD